MSRAASLSRNRKLALAALITIVGGGLACYVLKQNQPMDTYNPRISNLEYIPEISPGVSQNINFTATDVDAYNNTSSANIAKAAVEVTPPEGQPVNVTAGRLEGDLFSTQYDSTGKEGVYLVSAIVEDRAGNAAVEHGGFEVRDRPPTIESYGSSLIQVKRGDYITLYLQGKDDVGIEEAYVDTRPPNATKHGVQMSSNSTHYVARIKADQKGQWAFDFSLVDSKGQTTSIGPITVAVEYPVNEYVNWAVDSGINENIAMEAYQEFTGLVEHVFYKNKSGLLEFLKLANENATLPFERNAAAVLATTVYGDPSVDDPPTLIADISRLFNALKRYSSIDRSIVCFIGNLTKYRNQYILPFYGEDALGLGICVVSEDPGINKDFTPRQHNVYCLLMRYNPEIARHKLGTKAGTLQVDSIVYGKGMDKVKGEKYVWSRFVQPRVAHIVQLEDGGRIDCLDYGDLEAERGVADPELEMKTARSVLLPIELTEVYIKTGERMLNPPSYRRLEVGEANVNSDTELGKSPQEFLRENISDQYFEKKGEIYKDAMDIARKSSAPSNAWPNTTQSYGNEFDIVIQEDNEACFILGLPLALRVNYIFDPKKLTEQGSPKYAVLVGSERGRYVCIRTADYPTSPPDNIGHHTEAHILVKRTSDGWLKPHLFGFYLEKEPFKADYEGAQIEPHIVERDIDGNYNDMQLDYRSIDEE